MPTVSIIMNVRNGERYLGEALDSVMAQTFDDWELIVWDDNSTDDSVEIVRLYDDPRIRVFRSAVDVPLGRARDAAIGEARGRWLAFLDQDDVWLPSKLQAQLDLADSADRVGLVYGRTVRFGAGGRRDYDHRHEFGPLPEGDIRPALLHACFIAMSAAVIRRSALDGALPIPRRIHVTPDYWLFLCAARQHEARAVDRPVCRYRVHGANMTRSVDLRMHQEIVWLLKTFGGADERVRVHQTLLALGELRRRGLRRRGVRRLLTRGSVAYLASRPFARTARQVRRLVQRPRWRGAGEAALSATADGLPQGRVLRTRVFAGSFEQSVDALAARVERRQGGYVSPANAYSVTLAWRDDDYQRMVDDAAFVTPDGMPIVWVLRRRGHPAERVHNDDLFFACCERFGHWRHYLVGGRVGQPEAAAAELRRRYPGTTIVGTAATPQRPVSPARTREIIDDIRATRADVVWVGMGTPAQDVWMRTARRLVDAPMVGVGSSFDLLTGRSTPAPEWMKRHGLQWLHRFRQEPVRLARRYLVYHTWFVLAVLGQLLFTRPRSGV